MPSRVAKFKKNTRRGRKASRKATRKGTRKMRYRRQSGGGMYTFTVATPISATSTSPDFPTTDLGTFTAGNQQISFTNPTKSIVDIKVMNGATPYGASSFTVSSGTKVSIQVGAKLSLVPTGVSVRGATALPGAAATAGMTGAVTIKGLGASSFGTLPGTLTFQVHTSN